MSGFCSAEYSVQTTSTVPFQRKSEPCPNLTYLDLHMNQLSLEIPTEIGKLTRLKFLDLSQNLLLGGLPTEMGLLTQLSYLNLQSNQISGTIPSELATLTRLTVLGSLKELANRANTH
ncbi:hypothetical protein BDR26DRAFT_454144 [Obelidium mucronatum]|nr:hypothetical protein BDR26DRAFT_454144 [Obelidium mucronatum]